MNVKYVRQVELVRETEHGLLTSVGWIREILARVKFEDDIDTVVWKVRNVYGSRKPVSELEEQELAQKNFAKKLSKKIDRKSG